MLTGCWSPLPSGWLISRLVTSDREQPPDVPWCVLQVWLFPICGTTTFSDIVSWIRALSTNDCLWAKSGPWATNAFYIFKWLNKRSVLFRDAWKLQGIHISLSINEVLLAHSHAHWFILCELLLRSSGRRVWEWWPQSLTHLLSGSWQKQLADLLDHYLIQGRTHARLTGSAWRWL